MREHDSIHLDKALTKGLKLYSEEKYRTVPGSQRIELVEKGQKDKPNRTLAYCELLPLKSSFDFYYVSWVVSQGPIRRHGVDKRTNAQELMNRLNYFLNQKHSPALLQSTIKQQKASSELYKASGWVTISTPKFPDAGWYGYNLPTEVSSADLEQAIITALQYEEI